MSLGIIHAVGPAVRGTNVQQDERRKLGRCYWRSLDIAVQNGFRSIVSGISHYSPN